MKKFLLFALLFSALSTASLAQDNEAKIAEQSAKIESLEADMAKINERGNTWDKILKALPKISGYAQVRYDYSDVGSGSSTFQLRRVRVSFDGNITKKVDYKLQAELTSFKLVDAYFSYKPFTQLNVRAGQFKLPFSIENTDYGPTKIELIDYPMALTYLVGYTETIGDDVIKANGRDLGVKLYGSFLNKIIGYDIGVFNGTGLNVKDNNKSKDVVGRLSIKPIDGLLISGSYMWGEYGANYLKRERWGAGICYDKGAWLARSEYIGGTTDDVTSDGWYVMAGYRFCKNFMAVARYDSFAWNSDERKDTTDESYTVGITWQPVKYLRLQANYMYQNFSPFSGDKYGSTFQIQTSAMF